LQGGKTITISRAEINQAISTSATSSVAATTSSAPTSTPTPGSTTTAAPSVAPTPSASPVTVAPPAQSTGATSGTATATPAPAPAPELTKAQEYDSDISGSAKLLGTLLESKTGYHGYNYPVVPDFSHKVDKVLDLHPTLEQRVALIKQIGVMQLGELLHEAKAFDEVFDKIGAPLNTDADPNTLQKVKTAVELLHGEFDKISTSYDKDKIKQGLNFINTLSPEAEVLAAVYWTKFRKDQSPLEFMTYSYEKMKDTLKKAVGSTEGSKPEETPAAKEVAAPKPEFNAKIQRDVTEVKSILQTDLGVIRNWGLNNPFYNDLIDPGALNKLDKILNNYRAAKSRADLIDAIGTKELGELVHELPAAEGDLAMNKFLGTLNDSQIRALTGAVDTLMAEYGKSGWPLASAFDKDKIKEAFANISRLGDGAETFAKLVWYNKCNDDWKSWDYDEMKKTLGEASATQ
jgi:hypothetical protein